MHIYSLTSIGKQLARSVTNPDSPAYQVIAHLNKVNSSTTDQIAEFCGMNIRDASIILGKLKRHKIVIEVSGAPV